MNSRELPSHTKLKSTLAVLPFLPLLEVVKSVGLASLVL